AALEDVGRAERGLRRRRDVAPTRASREARHDYDAMASASPDKRADGQAGAGRSGYRIHSVILGQALGRQDESACPGPILKICAGPFCFWRFGCKVHLKQTAISLAAQWVLGTRPQGSPPFGCPRMTPVLF